MSKLAVVLLFATYLSVDFTSGSSIYRQTEDESSMHSQQDDGDRRSTSNLDKYGTVGVIRNQRYLKSAYESFLLLI